jgi:predicted ATPase/DNA-binding CsgD family transcriptional regulator
VIAEVGRLPAETSSFFGRSQEAAAVKGALVRCRLVTLTGPGGVGKTRLAVKVAGELAQAFPDGIFLADLSAARDAAGVVRAAAAALGLAAAEPGPAAGSPDEAGTGWLAGELRGRQLLLILDTAEHVIDACAAMADSVLSGGGGPVLLVTSRQALDLPGEVVFRIPPLAVGDDGGDAVALFADRAAAAFPGFKFTDDTLPQLVRLCRQLDGLPLAIELAALRLRAVGLDELLTRLPGQLRLLATGRRAASGDRQQSLEASVAWSYQLCSPAEQLLWTRLSVFADGFDLAAAEAVCEPVAVPADGFARPGSGVLSALVGLVDKSVVLRTDTADTAGAARYRLLAIIREYGAAQATAVATGAERHRRYYLGVARAFAAAFTGPGQLRLVDELARDEANLRLAFDGSLAAADAAAALELATMCWPWLVCTGRLAQAASWLDHALALDEGRPQPSHRGRGSAPPFLLPPAGGGPGPRSAPVTPREAAWVLRVWVLSAQGDVAAAGALRAGWWPAAVAGRAVPADPGHRAGTGEPPAASDRLVFLAAGLADAFAALRRGAWADCAQRCDELAAGLPAGERWARGWALWLAGVAGWCAGDRAAAGASVRAGLELLAPFGDELAVAQHLEALAWLAAWRGDGRRTARLQGAADRMWQWLAASQGLRAPRFGDPLLDAERDLAQRQARDALGAAGYAAEHAAAAALSTAAAVTFALPGAASPYRAGETERSSERAYEAWPQAGPGPLPPVPAVGGTGPGAAGEAGEASVAGGAGLADLGSTAGGVGFGETGASGVSVTGGVSVTAPGGVTGPGTASATSATVTGPGLGGAAGAVYPRDWALLTAREREVAALIAAGLTNKDIAARLVVSKRTVDAHVEHILGKLNYNSRVQVAALASREQSREQARDQAREQARDQPGGPPGARSPAPAPRRPAG